jgi:hypothetical protein
MAVDLRKFFQATDPGKALAVDNPEDKKYYIDFSSVRGGAIIKKLKQKITFFSPMPLPVFYLQGISVVANRPS